jgi:glycosyltransferase involved in cell wall biosynthesis
MDVSIVVPLINEDESLPELCSWIETVVTQHNLSYEVILVDDGSTDNSWAFIEKNMRKMPVSKASSSSVTTENQPRSTKALKRRRAK